MVNFRENVKGYLIQGRFSSCPVYNGEYLFATVRYVEQNPVKAKMATHPCEYPWSSAGFHCGLVDHDPLVSTSSLLSEITDWKTFLSTESNIGAKLEEKNRTGRPFGPENFFTVIEKLIGRDTRKKLPGRPKIKE